MDSTTPLRFCASHISHTQDYALLLTKAKVGLAALLIVISISVSQAEEPIQAIALSGRIVDLDRVRDGTVLVEHGVITEILPQGENPADLVPIRTDGYIFPGLIDLHNHVTWNCLPEWQPPRTYRNRSDWRDEPSVRSSEAAFRKIRETSFCDLNTYSELRALAWGTTSIVGTQNSPCITGGPRNIEFETIGAFHGAQRILSLVEIPKDTTSIRRFLDDPGSSALLLHLCEGVDEAARQEFHALQRAGLLTAKTVIIHGVALREEEFRLMAKVGASLVWSPKSNMRLYGDTADVITALNCGVRVAIAPDWSITGSQASLQELAFAAGIDQQFFKGAIGSKRLFAMATAVPAQIVGASGLLGRIQTGSRGDLLVLRRISDDPFDSIVRAGPSDVRLVVVNGLPLYGDYELMARYWPAEVLQPVPTDDGVKCVVWTWVSPGGVEELTTRLRLRFLNSGNRLSPIFPSK